MIINCEGCKQDFESARKKRFCTSECRDKSYLKNHPSVVKVCPGCSTEFSTSKPDKKWCSKKCADRVWSKDPIKRAQSKAWRERNPDKRYRYEQKRRTKEQENKPLASRIYVKVCQETGRTFISRAAYAKYSKEGQRIANRRYQQINKDHYPSHRWPKSEHVCVVCDGIFIGTPKSSICSEGCRKVMRKVRRKETKLKGKNIPILETVIPLRVFNRYKWKCAICGCETPKDRISTSEHNAPTVDHIIPLSKGGAHNYYNTQLACWLCNVAKNDLIMDNQSIEEIILRREYIKLNKLINEKQRELNHC